MQKSEPIVSVSRGPLIECYHRGYIVVVNALGQSLYSLGNPSHKTFARSTAKLFQTIPLIETGGADHFALSPQEIAIICASHNGEPEHVSNVQTILTKLGIDASLLQCGIHEPFHQQTRNDMRHKQQQPTTLHNNCSGKHAGMLALAIHLQSSLSDYMLPEHPVQQKMLETICDLAEVNQEQVELGVDGCGVPVYGFQIDQLALAFARFGSHKSLSEKRASACQRITDAE